jgi:hypothetical protein
MSEAEPRPEAVEAALAWLRGHEATFTRDALASGLRDAGYSEAEIAAAFERLDREALEPATAIIRSTSTSQVPRNATTRMAAARERRSRGAGSRASRSRRSNAAAISASL